MILERKKNAFLGTLWGMLQKIITILFPFFVRTIFIRVLGANYLGLNGLFTSILSVLNLAELGFSSALVFSMYRPIVDDDQEKICALMNLYKFCYRVIGLVVLIIGLCLMPFIPFLIHGEIPNDLNVYIIYSMNLGATVLSYWLFAYRNVLFNAHQRTDIIGIISSIVYLFTYSLQLLILLLFQNYYIYLIIHILSQILLNISIAIVSKIFYPHYIPVGKVPKEERKVIFQKVRDLFTAKVGAVVNNSTDSIVISTFLGLKVLGIYQNYYFLISVIISFFLLFFNACNAGIANSLIVNKEKDNIALLYKINYISFFGLNFCCSSLLCLTQPFIQLWLGSEYLLSFQIVIFFVIYLYAEVVPRTFLVFKDAAGVWREDRFRPLVVSFVNLFLNCLTVKWIGLYGIIISTVVSLLLIGFPWAINNINKHLLKINIKKYIKWLFCYTIVIIFNCLISFNICRFIVIKNLKIQILLKGIICLIFPNVFFILLFFKTEENKYLFHSLSELFTSIKRNIQSKK